MKHPLVRSAICILAVVALVVPSANAQTVTGSLVGRVTDSSDAVMVDARVVAVEVTRGVARETRTNESGTYSMASMEPGVYRIEIERGGFKKFVSGNVEVSINSTVRVDAKMVVGDVSESIQVAAEGAVLKTDRADLGTQIASAQVENLPLTLDRNYQGLMTLVPGVTEPTASGSLQGNPQGALQYNANGQNLRANNDRVEGTANYQINTQARIVLAPPADAIQVVDVTTNAYDAEHGQATGAIVNVVLKSGSNQIHGSVFEYNVNSALKARNALSALPPTPANMNQFGFTLGGPIRKNRTFFFGDYQGGLDHRPSNALLSVPTADYRAGNFASATTLLYDPATGTSTANRDPFPNNTIPAARFNLVANNILKLWPQPNLPGRVNNYAVVGSAIQNREAFDIKVNHNFSDRTQAFASYSYFHATTTEVPAFGDLGGPATTGSSNPSIGTGRNQRLSLNLTRIFSSSLLAEFRAGFTRALTVAQSQVDPDMATKIGIPGINKGDLITSGLPQFSFTDYSFLGVSSNLPFKIPDTSVNLVSNWTKTKGGHTIRWGAEFVDLLSNVLQVGATRGTFTFASGVTARTGTTTSGANSFGAVLLGLPQSIIRATLRQPGGLRIREYSLFVQDRWQATRKLTVNYGLRYEVLPAVTVAKAGDQSLYDFVNNRILVAGYGPNNMRANVATDWTNFAPRLGVAYRLGAKTVVRSGYGISYSAFLIKNVNSFPSAINQSFQGATALTPLWDIRQGIPDPPVIDWSSGIVQNPPGDIALTARNLSPRRGYTQSFNLSLQREVARFIVEAAYVGGLGTRIPIQGRNLNTARPGAATSQLPLALLFGRTAAVTYADYMVSTAYHALQTKVARRFAAGSLLTVAYTWSKSLDYANDLALDNNLDINLNRGVSSFDRRHNLVVSPVLSTPFGGGRRFLSGGGKAAMILGGWRFSGVFVARSGSPVSVSGNRLAANAAPSNTNRPDRIAQPKILGGQGPGQKYFDTAVFVEPAPGNWGNAGRNTLRGPGYVNLNGGLFREFPLPWERYKLQFRLEAFNVTNTPHFGNPSGSFTAAAFGQISSTSGERQARLGLRLSF
jgi:hypothetical protein